jgi:hypothetical protein
VEVWSREVDAAVVAGLSLQGAGIQARRAPRVHQCHSLGARDHTQQVVVGVKVDAAVGRPAQRRVAPQDRGQVHCGIAVDWRTLQPHFTQCASCGGICRRMALSWQAFSSCRALLSIAQHQQRPQLPVERTCCTSIGWCAAPGAQTTMAAAVCPQAAAPGLHTSTIYVITTPGL